MIVKIDYLCISMEIRFIESELSVVLVECSKFDMYGEKDT